MDEDAPSWLI